MQNNFLQHIAELEEEQFELEVSLSETISSNIKQGINAIQRQIPSLMPFVSEHPSNSLSIFCNKDGNINIVNHGLGRTVYGLEPQSEIQTHLAQFEQKASYVHVVKNKLNQTTKPHSSLHGIEGTCDLPLNYSAGATRLPDYVECLVVLGIGLGLHIKSLIENYDIKHLIIYEPEWQFLRCSLSAFSWKELLDIAQQKGTSLYIQLCKDGRDITKDIQELNGVFPIDGFYIYKHFNHPIFNQIYRQVTQENWSSLIDKGFSFKIDENYHDYTPYWCVSKPIDKYKQVSKDNALFQRNLNAMKVFFPNIYADFSDYSPQKWLPVQDEQGNINVLHKENGCCFYGEDPRQQCSEHFSNFAKHPSKDGLILGYTGEKLAHYIHYKFVKSSEKLLRNTEEKKGKLSKDISSIIIFGLGIGYQLEEMLEAHQVENLFVCEPNRDFFYATLFAIDWAELLKKINASKHRIYLNIGDDGRNMFNDLMGQFYSIGPFLLNNTFFYNGYYNDKLLPAIASLRENLKIVISMGEYFDHAYYGIAQTLDLIHKNCKLQINSNASPLSWEDKNVPIFLIGNGPSLDDSIEYIKEHQDSVILISCGTTLKTLHKHGIHPDFQAEIEQNRATYDWASLVDDKEYISKVDLLSCNGIHPDTCDLYNNVYVTFKEGESSTVSTLEVLGAEKFEVLKFAFPTVANFTCNLFSRLKFRNIYFIGIDLGFIDAKRHHSKHSDYYDKGTERFDYSLKNSTSLKTPGNFVKEVNTKPEFRIAREMMENIIRQSSKDVDYFNCSNGARIKGAVPLYPQDILISSTASDKIKAIDKIKNQLFQEQNINEFSDKYYEKYDNELLLEEISDFEKLLNSEISQPKQANALVYKQNKFLFDSLKRGNTLLFYYLYGSTNYANALLLKLLNHEENEEHLSIEFHQAITLWRNTFDKMKNMLQSKTHHFDTSAYITNVRENLNTLKLVQTSRILMVTNSDFFLKCISKCIDVLGWNTRMFTASFEQLKRLDTQEFDYILYDNQQQDIEFGEQGLRLPMLGKVRTIVSVYDVSFQQLNAIRLPENCTIFWLLTDGNPDYSKDSMWRTDPLQVCYYALTALLKEHISDYIIMKYVVRVDASEEFCLKIEAELDGTTLHFSEQSHYFCVRKNNGRGGNVLPNGTREEYLPIKPDSENFIGYELNDKAYNTDSQEAMLEEYVCNTGYFVSSLH